MSVLFVGPVTLLGTTGLSHDTITCRFFIKPTLIDKKASIQNREEYRKHKKSSRWYLFSIVKGFFHAR